MAAAVLVWVGGVTDHTTDVNYANNWQSRTVGESNRVPLAGDTIYFNNSAVYSCSTGLSTLAAVSLAGVVIEQTFSLNIGDGTTGYLKFLCSGSVDIGKYTGSGTPQGSSSIMLDVGTTATSITVHNSGTSTTSQPAILLKANNASTTLTIKKGQVGLAVLPGETSTVSSVTIGYVSNQATDSTVTLGSGVTVTTIDKIGGTAYVNCASTTTSQSSGTLYMNGTGATTTVNISGGVAYLESSGTITNLNCKGGKTDMGRSRKARTVTNITIYPGASYIRDNSIVTETNKITTTTGIITIGAN